MFAEVDFFSSGKPRASEERVQKIKLFDRKADGENFSNFGYDYFDNPEFGVGYGGYHYDGRYSKAVSSIIEYFGLGKDSRVLELGCAKGFVLREFLLQHCAVRGVDVSEYAVKNAHEDVRKFISCSSCVKLQFPAGAFDFVYSKEMLPHLDEIAVKMTIAEIHRVVRDRKNVFFEIQVAESKKAEDLIFAWDGTHQTVKPAAYWRELLSASGFEGSVNFKELF
ncbi:class I SAM-dependent methyltransferase [Thalassospira sp. MA62]|nr:class I SAM-dependent methyltransferase [Thalassospira sp. MA62]